jgi:transposase
VQAEFARGEDEVAWAFAIARRSTMRKARVALARRLGIIMHAMLRDETEFASA